MRRVDAAGAPVLALLLALAMTAAPATAQGGGPGATPGDSASTGPGAARAAAPGRRAAPVSWTGDRRDFRVGDVISVLLDEYTMASANKNVTAEQERTRQLGAGGSFDGTGVGDAAVSSQNSGRSRDRGENTRRDRLTGEMTVRVVEVDPHGMLRVEGTKQLRIDKHEQQLTLTGWVRPEDVPPHNVIESWRIADASIQYTSKGDLGRARTGILTRILGWFWP